MADFKVLVIYKNGTSDTKKFKIDPDKAVDAFGRLVDDMQKKVPLLWRDVRSIVLRQDKKTVARRIESGWADG